MVISIVNINWCFPPSSSLSLSLSLCVSPQWLDALPLSLDVAGVYSLVVALTHGTRQRMVKSHPDSVYGDRTLVDLQWDNLCRRAGNQPGSSHALPKQPTQNPIPGSSCAPPPPHRTTTDANDNTEEDPVDTSGQAWLNCLVQEGGVEFIAFLLNKVVPMASDQLVFYKDIARLPSQLWEQWKKACQE